MFLVTLNKGHVIPLMKAPCVLSIFSVFTRTPQIQLLTAY